MKKKIILISDYKSIKATLETHKILIDNLSKSVDVFFLDKNLNKVEGNITDLSKGIKILNITKFKVLYNFFKNEDVVVWNNFGFSIEDLIIHIIIKLTKKKTIVISNLGNLQWSLPSSNERFFFSKCLFILKKIKLLIILLLVKLSLIKKIDIRFQSGKEKKYHRKNLFVDRYIYINSKYYDIYSNYRKKNKNKYIVHIDVNPNHKDDVRLRGKLSQKQIYKHYYLLNLKLFQLKKIYKVPVVICIHPLYDLNLTKKFFPNFKVYKYRTKEFIEKSIVLTFFDSSTIFNAVYLNKNIIILRNKSLGKSINLKSEIYKNLLKIPLIDINNKKDIDKKMLNHEFAKSKFYLKKYVRSEMLGNKNIKSYKEILNYLNEQSSY